LRTGLDLIEINRFLRDNVTLRQRFIQRVFTDQELGEDEPSNEKLAALFAAKEAVAKALGSGIGEVRWQDIEIFNGPGGQPCVQLKGKALQLAGSLRLSRWLLSISCSTEYALAVVVASDGATIDENPCGQ
jgi:holo-[acyl-carrier protein] synthase